MSIDEAQIQLDFAYKDYKIILKNTGALQESHLENLAKAQPTSDNTKAEVKLLQLQQREDVRRSSRRKIYVNEKIHGGTLIWVQHKKVNGDIVDFLTRDTIEHALLVKHKTRFSQIKDTPFLQEPLVDMVGLLYNTPVAQLILNREFQYNHLLLPTLQDVITELK